MGLVPFASTDDIAMSTELDTIAQEGKGIPQFVDLDLTHKPAVLAQSTNSLINAGWSP